MDEELRKIDRKGRKNLAAPGLDRVSAAPKKLTKRSSIIIFVPVCGLNYVAWSRTKGRGGNRRGSRVCIFVEKRGGGTASVYTATDVRRGQGGAWPILTRSSQITAPINYPRPRFTTRSEIRSRSHPGIFVFPSSYFIDHS